MQFGIIIVVHSPSEYGFKNAGDNMIPAYINIIFTSWN
jgi:hypothetical protein